MGSEHYCLRWNNHQNNLLGVFSQLLEAESLVDVTLASSEGHSLRAHKVVLSACSTYFRALFLDHPARHPIVILKDVCFAELRTLVEFMYRGEVSVETCRLSALLKTAESLKVKGLAEMTALKSRVESGNNSSEENNGNGNSGEGGGGGGGGGNGGEGSGGSNGSGGEENGSPSPVQQQQQQQQQQQSSQQQLPAAATAGSAAAVTITVPLGGGGGGGGPQQLSTTPPPAHTTSPPSSHPDRVVCPPISPPDTRDSDSIQSEPSDMTLPTTAALSPQSSSANEPIAGPSGLPPVQDAPLSLKKEIDWDRSDDKSMTGESSSEYRPHDPEVCLVEGEYGPGSSGNLELSTGSSRSSTPFHYPTLAGLATLYGETVANLLRVQGIEVTGVRCSVCSAGFPAPWLLDQHIRLQHPGHPVSPHAGEPIQDDKPFRYRCEQCGQSYRYRSAYLKHREQNHRARLPADKLFTCDVCGMQFRYLKSFKKHRLNHTLERLHSSPRRGGGGAIIERGDENQDEVTSTNEAVGRTGSNVAGSGNNNGGNVAGAGAGGGTAAAGGAAAVGATVAAAAAGGGGARTGSSDQDDTVDSAVEAVSSETQSGGESSLISLLRLNERARPPRSFACPFCGKCVRSKENLKLHVRKHTGERPFACLFCGRAFGGKSDLTRHLRIHTGERPYHCEMCGKCFARADYLSKHLTTHIHQGQHR